MIAIGVVGFIMLAITVWRGWHPYPFIGRAYRDGENASLFWLAVAVEVAFIAAGFATHFSN